MRCDDDADVASAIEHVIAVALFSGRRTGRPATARAWHFHFTCGTTSSCASPLNAATPSFFAASNAPSWAWIAAISAAATSTCPTVGPNSARSTADMTREGTPIKYLRSLFIPGEDKCFCLFDGPSTDAVLEANKRASLPFVRVVPAVHVGAEDLT